ncbi:hypothetical protein PG994_006936 [Apiospora phragmitis]|uniref:Uncharacterized protein n=1 Tax=Apiospora phragmitis TaxID=2905665 RepID=A0ABR1VGJ7_9PEZI
MDAAPQVQGEVDTPPNGPLWAAQIILNKLRSFDRPPSNFVQAWNKVLTDKTFLDKGFSAWFGYLLVSRAAETASHFPGKADCKRVAKQLEESDEFRQLVAEQVYQIINPEVEEKVASLPQEAVRLAMSHAPKRRNDLCVYLPTCSPAGSSTEHATSSEKRTDAAILPNTFLAARHILYNASLRDATDLFPPFISSAIRRTPHPANPDVLVAAITMSFPATNSDTFECQLSIEITENKIERIAREIFEVDLETTAGLRYVCLPGVVKFCQITLSHFKGAVTIR